VTTEVDVHAANRTVTPVTFAAMYGRFAVVPALGLVACHVTTQTEITRPNVSQRVVHPEGAVGGHPTIVLTDAAELRFVEALDCPTEDLLSTTTAIEVGTEPNLATFVVGVIATAVGGVMTVRGVTDRDGASNPFTYGGLGSVAVGLPLAIGPWIGTRTELRAGPEAQTSRPGPNVACGSRALPARSATLTIRDVEVHGTVDRDGVFSISPYQLVDAYEVKTAPAWDISAVVDTEHGARTITTVVETGTLAGHAQVFLEHADFDAKIQPLRLVPNVSAGTLRASLTQTATGPALRIVLPVKNDGPGETWGLRGQIASPTKAVDGRMIYLGHVGKGAAVTRELLIPLAPAAADAIRGATIDLSVELRDAHGTAPATPIRFRGAVLGDAPR